MKKLTIAVLTFALCAAAFAGPFGLNMGMGLEEIAEACGGREPEYIADDRYFIQPVKSHPLFEGYVVWVGAESGLYYIKGISREIQTTDYGTEAKQEFSRLLSPLERKYGKFTKINTLERDVSNYMRSEENWMRTLARGSRTYEAHWEADESNFADFDGLATIAIGIKTQATYITNEAYIWIEYGFANQGDGFGALDDVL